VVPECGDCEPCYDGATLREALYGATESGAGFAGPDFCWAEPNHPFAKAKAFLAEAKTANVVESGASAKRRRK